MRLLLEVLADGVFHSGEELGRLLGVSRSAVWKQLKRFSAYYGLEVQAVRGQGYRLASPLSLLLSSDELSQRIGLTCHLYESIDSTNQEAYRLYAKAVHDEPFLVTAERQTAGRGRRGREWISPFAQNIYLTMLLPIKAGSVCLDGLSLSVGVALYRALSGLGLPRLGLKWPNDVLLGGRKLAGILLELHGDPQRDAAVAIGIGINVNMLAAEVDQAWASLRMVAGRLLDRNFILELIVRELQLCVEQHLANGFIALQSEWQRAHLWHGQQVRLSSGEHMQEGVVEGVDQTGALLLRQGEQVVAFSGGELSLRLAHDS